MTFLISWTSPIYGNIKQGVKGPTKLIVLRTLNHPFKSTILIPSRRGEYIYMYINIYTHSELGSTLAAAPGNPQNPSKTKCSALSLTTQLDDQWPRSGGKQRCFKLFLWLATATRKQQDRLQSLAQEHLALTHSHLACLSQKVARGMHVVPQLGSECTGGHWQGSWCNHTRKRIFLLTFCCFIIVVGLKPFDPISRCGSLFENLLFTLKAVLSLFQRVA